VTSNIDGLRRGLRALVTGYGMLMVADGVLTVFDALLRLGAGTAALSVLRSTLSAVTFLTAILCSTSCTRSFSGSVSIMGGGQDSSPQSADFPSASTFTSSGGVNCAGGISRTRVLCSLPAPLLWL